MMALPTSPTSWTSGIDLPSQFFGTGSDDYELYEEDGQFVLSVELPGFERDDISLNWYDGRLDISAEHENEARGRKRTYHRTFRMPKAIEPEEISAQYRNGVLDVTLPVKEGAFERGHSIEVEG